MSGDMQGGGAAERGPKPIRRRNIGRALAVRHALASSFVNAMIERRPVVPEVVATRYAPRKDCDGSGPARCARGSASCSRGSVITRSNSAMSVAFGRVGSSASGRSAASGPNASR